MFEYSDAQQSEAIAWLVLFVGFMVVGAIGCAVHGLHREYRQYLKYRKFCDARKTMYEGGGK